MRNFLTIITTLVCAFTFAQKKPNINKAKSALEKGELVEAKTIIDQAIEHEKTKDDAKTWFYRGMVYVTLDTAMNEPGALETAMESFNKSLEIDPEQKSTSSFTGTGLENVDSKITDYYGYYYNKALSNYKKEDFEKAIINFETSFFINPSDTNAILNAAYSASAAGNHEKAKNNYQRSYEAGVRDKSVFLQLYNYSIKEENMEEALVVVRNAKEKYPNDTDFSKFEINLLINLDRIQDAKNELERAISLDPQNPDLVFNLGIIQEELGEVETAKETYKRAIEIDKDHYNSNFNLGVLIFNELNATIKERNALGYKEQKKYDTLTKEINVQLEKALPTWEKLYDLNNKDRSVLETLKYIYANLKMNDRALKMADELDALD